MMGLLCGFTQQSIAFTPGNQEADLETRYIVKFKDAASMSSMESADLQASDQNIFAQRHNLSVRKRLRNANAISVAIDSGEARRLRSDAAVEYVELDPPRQLLAQSAPWGIAQVQADMVSDSGAGNRTVCIIDSGYDINNPDLVSNNHSGSNDSGTGNWFVPGGSHGTHVAGTIAAVNNDEGVLGVLPNTNVNIHIVKVFNASGWGYSSDLVNAIQTCANNGANVVNMSLGGDNSSTTERNALQSIANSGVLLIAAAGNDGNTSHSYPASYPSVVSVAATDENNQHAVFSQATNQVEISAPGVAVLSTVGLGDGKQGYITVGSTVYGDDQVVPSNRFIQVGGNFQSAYIGGSASGELRACSVSSSGNYSCGNMNGRICIAERFGNQGSGNYPDFDPVMACVNAGAEAAIVYSNSSLPALQNNFLVDENSDVDIPSVSVDRALGQSLLNSVGQTVTLESRLGTDYAYYNGTSMATPHVAAVAALVWSHHPSCSASEIRSALTSSALDIDSNGRDNRTGFGLIQASAALTVLNNSTCGGTGPNPGELQNGVAVTGLSAGDDEHLVYQIDVPANATNLSFDISGGSGDADLYVRFGSEPTLSTYDCRPWRNGNTENCSFATPSAGTWYVHLVGYTAFNNVSLVASFVDPDGGGDDSFENNTDVDIPDNSNTGVTSSITSTRSGASGAVTVDVEIIHTWIGDLIVDVIHPDGTVVNLHNRTGRSADDIMESYQIDFGNRDANGEWRLRVRDRANRDVGYIDRWQINF